MPLHVAVASADDISNPPAISPSSKRVGAIVAAGGLLWIAQPPEGDDLAQEPGAVGESWVLYCGEGERETIYFVHDNGGRPFMVRVSPRIFAVYVEPKTKKRGLDEADVHKTMTEGEHIVHEGYVGHGSPPPAEYSQLVVGARPYIRVFAATDEDHGPTFGLGHAVLIEHISDEYVFVGWRVEHFQPQADKILDFKSYIAGSDVAYPYAEGEARTYLMVEGRCISNDARVDGKTPYEQYFDSISGPMRIVNGMMTTRAREPDDDEYPRFVRRVLCDRQ